MLKKRDWIFEKVAQVWMGRKHVKKIFKLLIVILFFPAVLFLRLLRPFISIRIGSLRSERIGHFIADTEVYLCESDKGMHGGGHIDVFYHRHPISNKQLKKMWNRTIRVYGIARFIDFANRHIPGGEKHVIPRRRDQSRDVYGVLNSTKIHLRFTPEEEHVGMTALQKMGVPEESKFICFHARDSEYLDSFLPGQDWSYHRYRDCDIRDFIPTVEKMADRGYTMIRMGAKVKDKLNVKRKEIIDYANNGRTDFLDIYLASKCRFFLGSPTGIIAVPMMFRRPVVCVNVLPYACIDIYTKKDLVLPKKLWHTKEKRFLTFREIFSSDVLQYDQTQLYLDRGLEVIDNTPEEICEVAEEMDEILDGRKIHDDEEKFLQKQFYSYYNSSVIDSKLLPRIGSGFLKRNKDLLFL